MVRSSHHDLVLVNAPLKTFDGVLRYTVVIGEQELLDGNQVLCMAGLSHDRLDHVLQVIRLHPLSDLSVFVDSHLEVRQNDVDQISNLLLDERGRPLPILR